MKKILTTAALSGLLVMGGATAALATHAEIPAETAKVVAMGADIVLDGSVRVRGYIDHGKDPNDTPDIGKDPASSTGYDTRARLGVKARVNEQIVGYIQLETGADSKDYWTWGRISDADLSRGGSKQGNDMELLQAWLAYSPGNWGIKAGHMPLALGNKLFFDHTGSGDDAIVAYGNINGFEWNALTIKLQENTANDNSDDLDAYVLNLTNTFNGLKANVNYTLLKGGAEDDGPAVGSAFSSANLVNNFPGLEMSNLGIALDYTMGDLALKADGEFQFGTFYDAGAGTDIDNGGWAMMLSADYKLGAGSIGLLYGYGTGDDNATDKDLDTFVPFLTDTAYQVYIPGYRIPVPGSVTTSGQYSGLSNLTLYQLNGTYKATCPLTGKPLSLRGSLSYMNTSEDYTANGVKQDEIGWEADLVASWQLTDGLVYKVELAYLDTGDVYNTAENNNDPDACYFIRHGLEVAW